MFFKYWPQNGCISIEIIQQNQKIYLYTLIADQENHPNGHMTQ